MINNRKGDSSNETRLKNILKDIVTRVVRYRIEKEFDILTTESQKQEFVNKYIEEQHTFFVLENLETLRKNGRLSRVKALVATALKIKPIMGSTPEGRSCQLDQARGMNKALVKMVDKIVEVTENSENKILAISHCNSPKKANMLKEAIQEKMKLADIVVLDTAGVSSMYANDGGIIVAV